MKNGRFVVSYRLLALLQWLADNEGKAFKHLIQQAMKHGLTDELRILETIQVADIAEEAQQSIIDFFSATEKLLDESLDEERVSRVLTNNLLPTLKQIDTDACDQTMLARSVSRTTTQLESNPADNPQETLYKELLRRWKPDGLKNRN